MSKPPLKKSARGAVATGASATGAASLAAMAMGAMALGAMAIGALAVGRVSVGRARLRRLEIGELSVGRLEIGAEGVAGKPTAVCRVRAAPGKGDAFARLVLDELAADKAGGPPFRAHRSEVDPDRFLLCETRAEGASLRRGAPRADALLRKAAAGGLLADGGPVDLELYRTI